MWIEERDRDRAVEKKKKKKWKIHAIPFGFYDVYFFIHHRQHVEYWILLLCQRMMYIFMCHFWIVEAKRRRRRRKQQVYFNKKTTQKYILFLAIFIDDVIFVIVLLCICATFQGLLHFWGFFLSLSFFFIYYFVSFTTSPSSHMNRLAGFFSFSVTLWENDESCDSNSAIEHPTSTLTYTTLYYIIKIREPLSFKMVKTLLKKQPVL